MKELRTAKNRMADMLENSKKLMKEKKNQERKLKQELGKTQRQVLHEVEKIFVKHNIAKPYYHGGAYNGKAMNQLMTNSSKIMEEVREMLLDIPNNTRCSDDEVTCYSERFMNVLKVFDELFSLARTPSGKMTGDDTFHKLSERITESMRLWRGLGLNITPKAHAIEDHLFDQIRRLHGIGDLGEDFLEQSHQDGIKDHARSRNSKREHAALQHSKWEEQRLHPGVKDKIAEVAKRSVRLKRSDGGEMVPVSKRADRDMEEKENKNDARRAAYAATTFQPGVYLSSGRTLNINDATRGITQADIQRHEIEVQTFIESNINRLPRNAAHNHRNR